MDDDFDIYEDLPLTCNINNVTCSQNNEDLSQKCEQLKKEVTELMSKFEDLRKINETLEVNFSSLLKTAKAEIARKDKMIDELRRQVDNMSFRRGRFKKNIRESNNLPVQVIPISNIQELNNARFEDQNLTNEEASDVKTKHNGSQFDPNQDASDYGSYSNECRNAKYRAISSIEPVKGRTIFTERLRKRIMEEERAEYERKLEEKAEHERKLEEKAQQERELKEKAEQDRELEEKEKQNLLLENNHEDKEINIDDKENQSQFSIWSSNVDNTNLWCKGTDHDYARSSNNIEDTSHCVSDQERVTLSTTVSGKRADHETDLPCSKRRKLEVEQNVYISKNSLPKTENIFNGYDSEIVSNVRTDKSDYEDNTYSQRNDFHYNIQSDRDNSRLRSTDSSYKRKERYKKYDSDYNYSTENTHYYEKDKYNRSRRKSSASRYSERKYKYHDDKHKDHRDRFDKKLNVRCKEDDSLITCHKRVHDLRDKIKHRSDRKHNTTEFNSSRSRRSKYLDSHFSRSVSHERSKSDSRERTSHRSYERKSSKSSKTSNNLEERANLSLKKKDDTRKKDDVEKLVKTNVSTSLKDVEMTSDINNIENTKLENSRESIQNYNQLENTVSTSSKDVEMTSDINNIENTKLENSRESIQNYSQLENTVPSKSMNLHISNDDVFIQDSENKNVECNKTESNDTVEKAEDIIANVTEDVNNSREAIDIPIVESNQDCTVTTIVETAVEEPKCDKDIVKHQEADEEIVNVCNNIEDSPKDITEISSETRQENNATCTYEIKTEETNVCNNVDIIQNNVILNEANKVENNEPEDKEDLSKNNLQNETPASSDPQEPSTTKPLHKNEKDNSEQTISKVSTSKKCSPDHENSTVVILSRRRRRIQLADNNASMTIVINGDSTKSDKDINNDTENNLKSRSCKVSRSYKDVS